MPIDQKLERAPVGIGPMGLTEYVLPWLGARQLVVIEALFIASLSFLQIALLVIRNPLLFEQALLPGLFTLLRLFFTSPMACALLGGLVIGYLVTGVAHPGKDSPKRFNVLQTLRATWSAVVAGLVSIVPMILGVLHPNPLGFGIIVAGFFVGPWFRGHFTPARTQRDTPSRGDASFMPIRRKIIRALPGLPFLSVGLADGIFALSVKDNRVFLEEERADAGKIGIATDRSGDRSIKVARLSTGLIRYRTVNPQGRDLVLGFHGFLDSLEVFPPELETTLNSLDMQGIFLDRPGIGPVSTLLPGLNFEVWSRIVEEFVEVALNNEPISIIGHSAGGLYALACAKLARVRALALVCSITPTTFGSVLRGIYHHRGFDPATLGVELFPNHLVPVAQEICEQIHRDDFKMGESWLGPEDRLFVTKNKDAFLKNTETSIAQGPKPIVEDVRDYHSPWPITPADTARITILIFNGAGDRIVRPSDTEELRNHFAPYAHVFPPLEGMGHLPTLQHFEMIFGELQKSIVKKPS
jgi:pimeloyl-ACP methyl ester carboxylesterase